MKYVNNLETKTMKMLTKRWLNIICTITLLSVFASDAFAHEGHEGEHSVSYLFFAAVMLAGLVTLVCINKLRTATER
tara:strand:+ start:2173 stop:2403 length:231 start_codon:yes stop_codon:yes gene_type:complete